MVDRKIVQRKASQVTAISTLLSQALSERSQNIVFSTAYHGNTVLLVSDIAQFVDSFCGGRAFFALRVEHLFHKVGNVIERWGLGWSRRRRLGSLQRRRKRDDENKGDATKKAHQIWRAEPRKRIFCFRLRRKGAVVWRTDRLSRNQCMCMRAPSKNLLKRF